LVARSVANESICLLKNEDSILPLTPIQKVLILGDFASEPRINGGGSSELLPFKTENPIEEISRYTNATFISGYEFDNTKKEALFTHDIVLVFTGTTAKIESEGFDRSNLYLPIEQEQLIEQVARYHQNIIVINASGSAIDTRHFISNIKGFVQTWFLGSACGKAIADVLYGAVNPSGRLSETFPISIENTSVYPFFPGKGLETEYKEGLFTGYRFYDTHKIEVQFPFGFGLSYTAFKYLNSKLSKTTLKNNEVCKISVDVQNTGKIAGKEVVQCYIEYPQKEFVHPYKVLRSFKKVSLLPGEIKTVLFELSDADFSLFVPSKNVFLVENGEYKIHIGSSVKDIYFINKVKFNSCDICHIQKKLDFPADSWLSDEPERSKLLELLGKHRKLHWWEKEEPLERVLKRINQENGGSTLEYEDMLRFIGIAKEI
jgi:beta-glucosidase